MIKKYQLSTFSTRYFLLARRFTLYFIRTLRLVWAAAPRHTSAWALLLIVQGLLPAAIVALSRPLIDTLSAAIAVRGSGPQLQLVIWPLGLMLTALALTALAQGIGEWLREAQSEYIQDYIRALVHHQSSAADLGFYESAEYYDQLHQARDEADYRPLALLESMGGLAQNGITFGAMLVVIGVYGWWVPLLLCLSFVPPMAVVLRTGWQMHGWWQHTTPLRRRTRYFENLLTSGNAAAEMRLFGLSKHFQHAYQTLRTQLRAERLRIVRRHGLMRMVAAAAGMLPPSIAMLWMLWRALQGSVTLGDLAVFYQAFNRGQGLARSLLGHAGQIFSNSLFLGNLFDFLDLQPLVLDPPAPKIPPRTLQQGISIHDITFRYPGAERPALHHFSLWLPAGKVTAIVGANGAGKSTLIKLLCRFYDPEAGRIEFDGINLRDFVQADVRNMVTALFQSPVPYHASFHQNIAYGDIAGATTSRIRQAAMHAGADELAARLPQLYDTQLGKQFASGVELSGGEWQRVALARAFLRAAPIILLDEPTSAMDSWAESDWYARFHDLAHDRTALLITHRLTTAQHADIIHVIDQGQIVESGTHHTLLAQGGRYAASWLAQLNSNAPVMEDAMQQ